MPDAHKKKQPAKGGKKPSSRAPAHHKTESDERFSLGLIGFCILFMLLSTLFCFLDMFGTEGKLSGSYAALMKGLFGAGYYVIPFVFLIVVVLALFTPEHKKRPSQFVALLLLPTLVGAWGHIFTSERIYLKAEHYFSIYTDGKLLKSGGLVSGAISDLLCYLISPYGAGVVLFLITAIFSVWLCRFSLSEVLATLVSEFHRIGEDSDRAMDEKKEQYLKNREEKRTQREEQRRIEAEEKVRRAAEKDDFDIPAAGTRPDPREFDLPLDKDRPRPKGIFTFHSVEEEKTGEEGGEIAFEPADIVFETPEEPSVLPPGYEIIASTGEVVEVPAEETDVKAPQSEPSAPISIDIPLDEPENAPEEASEVPEVPAEEAVTGDMIYEYKEGDGDKMLAENGIDPDEIKVDETQVSSSLRPGEEEKARLAAALAAKKKPEYKKPSLDLLSEAVAAPSAASDEEIKANAKRLIETLTSFNIDARITNVIRGPSITRYEVQLKQGIRFSKLTALSDDIALSLAAQSVRIAAIPDKVAVGIEVPNKVVSTVYIRECLASSEFADNPSRVAFALGKDITGKCIVWDIAKLPHMLVAGTTGSGKSVCVNSLLVSLLYKSTPDEVKFIMIDPKIIELGVYNGIPHLMTPVVTDPKKAAGALQWAVYEMMRRYKQMADLGVRSIFEYNAEVERRKSMPEEPGDEDRVKMPQIVIVVDELADLMLSSPREVEEAICRLAQMARAAGMHLIIATQRPSADVITGLMKANIPSRIAFAVSSALDSRIILDAQGAERLVGKGDMLFSPVGSSKPIRIQGCFISSDEIEAVCNHAKRFGTPEYDQAVLDHIEKASESIGKGKKGASPDFDDEDDDSGDSRSADSDSDPLLNDAIDIVMETQMASASNLQRRLKLGYTRAARIIDIMEEKGIVGPFQGSKPRQILMSKDRWQEMKNQRSE